MNPAGILLVVAGTWVIAQVFAGDALRRLNIIPRSEDNSSPPSFDPQNPSRPGLPDPQTPGFGRNPLPGF